MSLVKRRSLYCLVQKNSVRFLVQICLLYISLAYGLYALISVMIKCLMHSAWTRVQSDDDIIDYAKVISVNASCSRYCVLALSLCFMTRLPYVRWTFSSLLLCIYSIGVLLYSYALPIAQSPFLTLKSLPKCNLSSKLRS